MTQIYDISKMNAQEVFETVASHLYAQGRRSMKDTSSTSKTCAYRGTEGRMCAVGIFIREKDYVKTMEGDSVTGLIERFKRNPSVKKFKKHAHLLFDLQIAHDETQYFKKNLKKHLKAVAKLHDLDYKFLDSLSFTKKE